MAAVSDYGAFMEKFILQPTSPSSSQPPLDTLTFAVKDIFDVQGLVTGFGNPDWARTHQPATSTAPAVAAMLGAGATCVGKTVMDEMAYSINGENKHYGTPVNPCAPDRVPGGSSSGSAVAVAAKLADFSLGTDTGGSVRVPASYCGIFGFRPSHGVITTDGVIPMAQSFDTVGWFARDPVILSRVGHVLLQEPDVKTDTPSQVIIADDCFHLLSVPSNRITRALNKSVEKLFGGQIIKNMNIGDYIKENVPSLEHFITDQKHNIPSLAALSTAMRLLQRSEFKSNHGEWVTSAGRSASPRVELGNLPVVHSAWYVVWYVCASPSPNHATGSSDLKLGWVGTWKMTKSLIFLNTIPAPAQSASTVKQLKECKVNINCTATKMLSSCLPVFPTWSPLRFCPATPRIHQHALYLYTTPGCANIGLGLRMTGWWWCSAQPLSQWGCR
uniref:Amidase domain-containing protein n=1 Tax=Kalanchoe fedtschenkoi TaxID=63787 RepID=A0A7N0V6F9_KALFE